MIKSGRVVNFRKNLVEIEVLRTSACGGCSEKKCGCAPTESEKMIIALPNPGNVSLDDKVSLEMADNAVTKAAILAYGFPLSGFIAGALIPSFVVQTPGDGLRALSALGGLIFALCGTYFISKKNRIGAISIIKP